MGTKYKTDTNDSAENNNNDDCKVEVTQSEGKASKPKGNKNDSPAFQANISKSGSAKIPEANRWCKTIAKYPLPTCLVLLLLNLTAAPLALIIRGFPDFSNPKMG